MSTEQDIYFVKIKDSNKLKKIFLESSRDVLEVLKRNEELRIIREKKKAKTDTLKEIIRESARLITKLKAELPKVDAQIQKKSIKKNQSKKQSSVKKVTKAKTELQKIESEIMDIEKKLKQLG